MKQKEELILKRVLSDMRETLSTDDFDVLRLRSCVWYESLRSLVLRNPLIIAFDDDGNRI